MNSITINSFEHYLSGLDNFIKVPEVLGLYRGQSNNYPLLPSICRENPKIDTTEKEKKMLQELKRRTGTLLTKDINNDWDWLTFAQHHGMKTRLLDWTSNPLAALWFACNNNNHDKDAYVYLFVVHGSLFLNREKEQSPFNNSKTRILKPNLNNQRIVAQSGWFSAHKYSNSSGAFVSLQKNTDVKHKLVEFTIPAKLQSGFLGKLNIMGINYQTMFPEISGVCSHLNWEFGKTI